MYCFFFFQAEDGIRDLVRSRGLGDVYKRQHYLSSIEESDKLQKIYLEEFEEILFFTDSDDANSVSYTHLTLPTSDLV